MRTFQQDNDINGAFDSLIFLSNTVSFFLWYPLSKVQIIKIFPEKNSILDLFLKRNLIDVPFSLISTKIMNGAYLVISRKGKLEITEGDSPFRIVFEMRILCGEPSPFWTE